MAEARDVAARLLQQLRPPAAAAAAAAAAASSAASPPPPPARLLCCRARHHASARGRAICSAPAASCTASIGFTAQAAGARSASLTLSATGATATVALSGTGTAPAPVGLNVDTGSKIDIGTVLAGSRVVRSITVAASGADILIAGIATTGTAFSIDPSSTCQTTAFMLTAGRTCTVVLVFSAMNDGTNTGTLTINSTAPSGPVAIDLSANVARPNAGSGGCSATGREGPADPLLLLLALASALLLWRRRAQARL